jgi:hypothetical protein
MQAKGRIGILQESHSELVHVWLFRPLKEYPVTDSHTCSLLCVRLSCKLPGAQQVTPHAHFCVDQHGTVPGSLEQSESN